MFGEQGDPQGIHKDVQIIHFYRSRWKSRKEGLDERIDCSRHVRREWRLIYPVKEFSVFTAQTTHFFLSNSNKSLLGFSLFDAILFKEVSLKTNVEILKDDYTTVKISFIRVQ